MSRLPASRGERKGLSSRALAIITRDHRIAGSSNAQRTNLAAGVGAISASPGLPEPVLARRAPRKGSKISAHPKRPNVQAQDRIFAWDTPFAEQHRASIALPDQLVSSTLRCVLNGLAESTRTTYGAGIVKFTQFCNHWAIPEEDRMPASYALLCAFLSSVSGTVADGSVWSYMAGVRAWHVFNHAPWHGDDGWVQLARSSASKEGAKFRKKQRAPILFEHLVALRRAISLEDPFHAAVWAVALVTFFGCRRLGETVVAKKFKASENVTRGYANIRFNTLRDGTKSLVFSIPWTKTTKSRGATVILTQRIDNMAREWDMCPLAAMENHLKVNGGDDAPASAALFAYRSGSTWKNLTRDEFLNFTKPIWEAAKLQYVSGHSFRIGGAVALLLAGVPPEVVAATGGWTSLAFLLYWRRVEEVLPLSTSKAYKKAQLDELAEIFEKHRISLGLPDYLKPTACTQAVD